MEQDPAIRASVERSLMGLRDLDPASAEDPTLARVAEELLGDPHVSTVWLFTPAGRLVLASGAMAASTPLGSGVEELATTDAVELISVLPDGVLPPEAETSLLAASAIRREGSHNDLYSHLLRPVENRDGSTRALIGVAYLASGWQSGIGWKVAVLIAALSLAVYWLSLPLWVLLDGSERGEQVIPWTAFVLIGNLVALVAYLLTRASGARLAGGDR